MDTQTVVGLDVEELVRSFEPWREVLSQRIRFAMFALEDIGDTLSVSLEGVILAPATFTYTPVEGRLRGRLIEFVVGVEKINMTRLE